MSTENDLVKSLQQFMAQITKKMPADKQRSVGMAIVEESAKPVEASLTEIDSVPFSEGIVKGYLKEAFMAELWKYPKEERDAVLSHVKKLKRSGFFVGEIATDRTSEVLTSMVKELVQASKETNNADPIAN